MIILLPQPRKLTRLPGECAVGKIVGEVNREFEAARAVLKQVEKAGELRPLRVSMERASLRPQGYTLSITPGQMMITAADPAGAFYAVQTVVQLQRQFPDSLPCLHIEDHPDFAARGVMLDISRDKVPTMAALTRLIDQLAELKINQLQLYTEHTFAYSKHERVWCDASPMTADEIRFLDEYCKQRFIDLVPNQNSFGHMERWLKHPEYQHLAEAIDGAETPWGFRWKGPFSLCPTDPGSIELLRGLYAELLPNFTSGMFNVGCDETFDIGQGRSKAECDRRGVTQVYLDFLAKVNDLVGTHGRRMMFWGDIIVKHPELISKLPENVIALEWGYDADHPFDTDGRHFAKAGVPFYVCPGTSSWNSITGRTDNAIANLKSAAENGLKHGAIGYLNTDWGDNGHLQYLPVSYLGFAAGAGYSWCFESNRNLDLIAALNVHIFQDRAGVLGQLAWDLGNIYQLSAVPCKNGSALFRVLVPPPNDPKPELKFTPESLEASEAAIATAMKPIDRSKSSRSDATLIVKEFANAAAILQEAVELCRARLQSKAHPSISMREIAAEHSRLWIARNRPGGLADSVRRLART